MKNFKILIIICIVLSMSLLCNKPAHENTAREDITKYREKGYIIKTRVTSKTGAKIIVLSSERDTMSVIIIVPREKKDTIKNEID